MRKNLHIFVDSHSQKSLDLRIDKERNGHVISGEFYQGEIRYPIIGGIPRFIDKSFYTQSTQTSEGLTSESFGYKWREKRSKRLGARSDDVRFLREQFLAVLGCQSLGELKTLLKNANYTLNAGCGVAWSEYLFNYGQKTMRHCIDLSLAVETAYLQTQKLENVIVSQASLFNLPYRDETFDIVYSIGVLHHTSDPPKAFFSLVKKVKPGGLIGIYIYNKKPFLRELADHKVRKITVNMSYQECMKFSRQMTNLGKALSHIKTPLRIKEGIPLLGIKKGTYTLQQFVYNYFIKCWYNEMLDRKYADLVNQDWYHPYFASHHTREEIIDWFKQARMKNIKFLQPKGWENSGYFVSGRKR